MDIVTNIRILHMQLRKYPTMIVILPLMKRSIQTIDSKYQSFHDPTDALSWLLKKVATMEKRRPWREFWIRSFSFLLIRDLMRGFLEDYPKHSLYCYLIRIYTYFKNESEALHFLSKIHESGLDKVQNEFFLEIASKAYLIFGKYDEAKQSLDQYQAVEQSHRPLIRLMKLESSNNHYDDMTRDEASLLLSSILDLLPDPQKSRAASEWADFISKSDNCPFQDPVHWAPFTLIGDPSLKISRSRQMDLSYAEG